MKGIRAASTLFVFALVLCVAVPAQATATRKGNTVDLLSEADVQIYGDGFNHAGFSVAGVGDFNKDGYDDVSVGTPDAHGSFYMSGSAFAVFPRGATGTLDLWNLGSYGLRMKGTWAYDHAGYSVASAGDVNGDGYQDVIVGAPYADTNGGDSGAAYVVFGTSSTAEVDLDVLYLYDQGFRIEGAAGGDYAGSSVAGAGDVNQDGYDDVIVGAPSTDTNGASSGSAYIVFGSDSTDTVNLSALGGRGFQIDGSAAEDSAGGKVAGAGDVDGDGYNDVIVGAVGADNGGAASGSAYVVFGGKIPAGETLRLDQLGGDGIQIDGAAANDQAGYSVAGAGDVNGDGYDDVIVGAPYASYNDQSNAGSAYVVFGQGVPPTHIDLDALDDQGLQITGASAEDKAGQAVSGVGDVDGDDLADVIVGAPNASNNERESSGSAYVVFGKATVDGNELIHLGKLGDRGAQIDGAAANDRAGYSVAGAGDVNGDGYDDVIVGAPYAGSDQSNDESGSAYVIYSSWVSEVPESGPDPSPKPNPHPDPGPDGSSLPPGKDSTSEAGGSATSPGGGSVDAGANSEPCTLAAPISSVSHWKKLGKHLYLRLKGPAGGYLVKSKSRARFRLQIKGSKRPAKRNLRRVRFKVAGGPSRRDLKAPFTLNVNPKELSEGRHALKATVYPRRGKKRTLRLRFGVSECAAAAFSVGLSPRRTKRHANADLRVRSGGAALKEVTFTMPGSFRWNTKRRAGKRIGRLKLTTTSGTLRGNLKLPRFKKARNSKKRSVYLLRGDRVEVRLRQRRPYTTITVTGLEEGAKDVTGIGVSIRGKQGKLLRNPRSCRPAPIFKAVLIAEGGKKLTLKRRVRVCPRGVR